MKFKATFNLVKIVRLSMSNCEFDENVRHVEDVDLSENAADEENPLIVEEILRQQQQAREIKCVLTHSCRG